jgi:hypothetical protein
MRFIANHPDAPFGTHARIEGIYGPAEIGLTFSADALNVARFDQYFSDPDGLWLIDTGTLAPSGRSLDELWTSGNPDPPHFLSIQQFVPRRGVGLAGYTLTAVTQTIDSLTYTQVTPYLVSNQEQTIRIYGFVVPESATIGLLFVALLHIAMSRCRFAKSPATPSHSTRA